MHTLESRLGGRWQRGSGQGSTLVNPATEEELAVASTEGLDLGEALAYARDVGGPTLAALSFAERAALLKGMAEAIHAEREALIDLGVANAGNTRSDAKFDIDGATGTLMAYAQLGAELPGGAFLADGDSVQLGRSPRFFGTHVHVPKPGVAVHINAFNFPAWGMMEKAACALLAGMPVLEKPGTPTAMLAERIAHLVVDANVLPEGAFSTLVGGAGDLLDHVGAQDVVAFTGSSGTASTLRRHDAFVVRGARLNVEADSLNAAVLGPDVDADGELFDMFVADVARDVTQKAGQKCTAIRRILVPHELVDAVAEALVAAVERVKVGDPADPEHRMGPLASRAQLDSVREGVAALADAAHVLTGGSDRLGDRGYFVAPTLLRADDAANAVFHEREVFGPASTILPYDGSADEASRLVALGGGGLVASVYSDDRRLVPELTLRLAPWSGRLYLGSSRITDSATGPGTVLPQLVHGGPGRAGGGEELGGVRGLHFYMQRTAVQGFKAVLESTFGA